jgi:hypothetical protein
MPITNFPGGVGSYGIPLYGSGSVYDMPWGKAWFVSNATGVVNGDGTSRDRPMVSLADALARASAYDTIFVGPGHAENVTASMVFSGTNQSGPNTGAQVIPQGVRIIGEGVGTNRPTFTLTAAASTFALANANSTLENIRILCPQTGTTTNATQVAVTAAGCMVRQCQFQGASSSTALATTCIQLSSAANDFMALDNTGFTVTGAPTSWLSTTGTAAAARVYIQRNTVRMILSATTAGIVDMSSASVTPPADWLISDNNFANLVASATVVIKGVASAAGFVAYNNLTGGVTTNLTTTTINTPGSLESFQNFVTSGGKWGIVGGGTGAQTS